MLQPVDALAPVWDTIVPQQMHLTANAGATPFDVLMVMGVVISLVTFVGQVEEGMITLSVVGASKCLEYAASINSCAVV